MTVAIADDAVAHAARLQGVLDAELAAYRELLGLSREKGEVIMRGALDDLNQVVEAEIRLLDRLNTIEEERAGATTDLTTACGLDSGVTLQDVASALPGPTRRELQERRRALLSVMDEVARLNAANESLLHQSLSYIDFSLSLFQRASGAGNAYGADGRTPGSGAPVRVQRRA